jgi:3-oxoacyl-[acyl-carrier protein] reductase
MTHTADTSTHAAASRHAHYPDLTGRTAVITGGSRGIGAATAAALAANGAAVAVIGRDKNALAAVTADITRAGGRAIWAAADCTQPDELEDMAATVTEQFGPIDILAIENDRMRAWVPEDQLKALAASFPLRRIGQPDDVAAATLFLASDASSWITGATLDIAGGKIMV